MSRWVLAGVVGLVGLVGLMTMAGLGAAQDDGPPLPQRMGAINDYAASLGRQTREQLQAQIDRLDRNAGVELAVLVSLLDPFGDPSRYADAIWREWGMGGDRAVLLVYVREAETRWAFRVRGSSAVADQVAALRSGGPRDAVDRALADRDVAEAVRLGVDALARQFEAAPNGAQSDPATDGPTGDAAESAEAGSAEASDASQDGRDARAGLPLWAWIAGGLGLLVLVLTVVVWTLLTWFCPRCGSTLRKRTESPQPWERAGRGGSHRSVYYCRNCRYVRRPRRRSRNRRSRRRTRGERRRAAGRRR